MWKAMPTACGARLTANNGTFDTRFDTDLTPFTAFCTPDFCQAYKKIPTFNIFHEKNMQKMGILVHLQGLEPGTH